MRPEINLDFAEQIVFRAYRSTPNRMALSSLALAAVAYLDVNEMTPDRSMRHVTMYKQTALQEVGRRLKFSATATSDETVACLRDIIAFEVGGLQVWKP